MRDTIRLPGAERAVADLYKLRDYCLNPLHPRGRHKARVFASTLGITQSDADSLRAQLLGAALQSDAVLGEADEHGQRYILDFECVNAGLGAMVRSSWIVRRGEDFPRLTSCYIVSK